MLINTTRSSRRVVVVVIASSYVISGVVSSLHDFTAVAVSTNDGSAPSEPRQPHPARLTVRAAAAADRRRCGGASRSQWWRRHRRAIRPSTVRRRQHGELTTGWVRSSESTTSLHWTWRWTKRIYTLYIVLLSCTLVRYIAYIVHIGDVYVYVLYTYIYRRAKKVTP